MEHRDPIGTVVLPCLDEATALPLVLPAVPDGWVALVVDNGSTDDSPAIAAALGARVVHEPRRGYGAAVHRGLLEATTDLIAVIDCDATVDPAVIMSLAAPVREDTLDLVCGRRRPTGPRAMPWHARWGNRVLTMIIRSRTGLALHDIAPVRVARRDALLGLGLVDRRFGYPLELLFAVAEQGWRIAERDVVYRPRPSGGRSKISGTIRGTLRVAADFARISRRTKRRRRPAPVVQLGAVR